MPQVTAAEWLMIGATAASTVEGVQQSNQQKAAASDQKDEQAVQRNEQAAKDALTRRNALREERMRRAQILQAAQNTGAQGSSGASGAVSSLAANIGANFSSAGRSASTAESMTMFDQLAQSNLNDAAATGATANLFDKVAGAASSYQAKVDQANRDKLLYPDGTTTTKVTPVL